MPDATINDNHSFVYLKGGESMIIIKMYPRNSSVPSIWLNYIYLFVALSHSIEAGCSVL